MRVEADLLILLGSPSSVNNHVMWVSEARKVVRRHLASGKPVFGICFEAQLIVSALGADVVKLEQPRLGFRHLGHSTEGAVSGNWLCFHEEHVLLTGQMEELIDRFRYRICVPAWQCNWYSISPMNGS